MSDDREKVDAAHMEDAIREADEGTEFEYSEEAAEDEDYHVDPNENTSQVGLTYEPDEDEKKRRMEELRGKVDYRHPRTAPEKKDADKE